MTPFPTGLAKLSERSKLIPRERYVFLAFSLRRSTRDMASPQGAGSEDATLLPKRLPHGHCVLSILRVPVFVEMEPILEMDAVIGAREPKQGRRRSDPDLDTLLDHCDIEN